MKMITIREIALKAGVSAGTVDRVLHHRGEVSPEIRSKVLQIAEEGGYTPNVFARHLKKNKVYTLGLLLSHSQPADYWSGLEQGMRQALDELGPLGIRGRVAYFDLHSPESFSKAAEQLLRQPTDGLVFPPMFKEEARKLAKACRELAVPFILLDSLLEGAGALSFIGQHAFDSGRVAARLFAQMQLHANPAGSCSSCVRSRNESNFF